MGAEDYVAVRAAAGVQRKRPRGHRGSGTGAVDVHITVLQKIEVRHPFIQATVRGGFSSSSELPGGRLTGAAYEGGCEKFGAMGLP